jgi:uncharacterized protein (DUF1778 family)
MSDLKRDRRIDARVTASVYAEIAAGAEEDGRSVSDQAFRVLLDWAATRVLKRQEVAHKQWPKR